MRKDVRADEIDEDIVEQRRAVRTAATETTMAITKGWVMERRTTKWVKTSFCPGSARPSISLVVTLT